MYGTVNELCAELLQTWTEGTTIALIVWSGEDVIECLPEMNITPGEADEILANISSLDDVHEYGVSQETIQVMLAGMRDDAE